MDVFEGCDEECEASGMPTVPLLYGDPSDRSLTSPEEWMDQLRRAGRFSVSSLPKYCILSFEYMGVKEILESSGYRLEEVDPSFKKAYIFKHEDAQICLFYLGIGAPVAGAELESLIALGVEYAILMGGVGVLSPSIPRWTIIVPNKAIRDEGTSYHYERPTPYSFPDSKISWLIKEILKERGLRFVEGAVWTTDAFYRETSRKREAFMRGGAVCVDMEASALFSIARFRRKKLAAIFYAGDYVGEEGWDLRIDENHEEKRRRISETLLEASLETLYRIHMKE